MRLICGAVVPNSSSVLIGTWYEIPGTWYRHTGRHVDSRIVRTAVSCGYDTACTWSL